MHGIDRTDCSWCRGGVQGVSTTVHQAARLGDLPSNRAHGRITCRRVYAPDN